MTDIADAGQGAGRRARGGGGAARRAERTAVSVETARFIERNIPNFEVLNEEALQIIRLAFTSQGPINFEGKYFQLHDAVLDVQAADGNTPARWTSRRRHRSHRARTVTSSSSTGRTGSSIRRTRRGRRWRGSNIRS